MAVVVTLEVVSSSGGLKGGGSSTSYTLSVTDTFSIRRRIDLIDDVLLSAEDLSIQIYDPPAGSYGRPTYYYMLADAATLPVVSLITVEIDGVVQVKRWPVRTDSLKWDKHTYKTTLVAVDPLTGLDQITDATDIWPLPSFSSYPEYYYYSVKEFLKDALETVLGPLSSLTTAWSDWSIGGSLDDLIVIRAGLVDNGGSPAGVDMLEDYSAREVVRDLLTALNIRVLVSYDVSGNPQAKIVRLPDLLATTTTYTDETYTHDIELKPYKNVSPWGGVSLTMTNWIAFGTPPADETVTAGETDTDKLPPGKRVFDHRSRIWQLLGYFYTGAGTWTEGYASAGTFTGTNRANMMQGCADDWWDILQDIGQETSVHKKNDASTLVLPLHAQQITPYPGDSSRDLVIHKTDLKVFTKELEITMREVSTSGWYISLV